MAAVDLQESGDETQPTLPLGLPYRKSELRPCRRFAESSTQKKGRIFYLVLPGGSVAVTTTGLGDLGGVTLTSRSYPLRWCRLEGVACYPRFETPRPSSTTKDSNTVHTPSPGSSPARRSPKTAALPSGWARCPRHRSNSFPCMSAGMEASSRGLPMRRLTAAGWWSPAILSGVPIWMAPPPPWPKFDINLEREEWRRDLLPDSDGPLGCRRVRHDHKPNRSYRFQFVTFNRQ